MKESIINPFSKFRTEYMGDSAWKYFVKNPFKEYVGERPLIFEGSRGTGKTMFFLCNSWKQKLHEAKANGQGILQFIQESEHIGFYYKVDTRFVKSMGKKNIDETIWTGIFNTYFNVIIGKEIVLFLLTLIKENIFINSNIHGVCKLVSQNLNIQTCNTFEELKVAFDEIIIEIEHFSNNTEMPKPIGLNAGTIIQTLISAIKEHESFVNKTFHIFVDEFESLNETQQVEINTLLKHSDNNVVYDYGVMAKGIQTFKTGTGQEIRPKDDFIHLSTDKYEYHESETYNNLLLEICKKRLEDVFEKLNKPFDVQYVDIRFYLKRFSKSYEEEMFQKSPELQKIKDRIFALLKGFEKTSTYTAEEVHSYFNELTNVRPILMRMHLALLLRKGKNSVAPHKLVEHKIKDSDKYRDWVKNMENAILFLLCHELKVEKKYHGFKVFSALSSGVIRSFLE
ncbi:MAG TPA: hypothetical protein VGE44_12780, partial [Daejeonella sp.]|uniref:ORC-CDC6 family AAA ATPase n=1 Tax=Daejeonella sp. TaxID=2805397 RepID=UPI002ED93CD3